MRWKRQLKRWREKFPAPELPPELQMLSGCVVGILTMLTDFRCVLLLLPPALYCRRRRVLFALLICALLGAVSAWRFRQPVPRPCGGELTFTVCDPRISQVSGIAVPGLIRIRAESLKKSGEKEFLPLREKLFLQLPYGKTFSLHYGEKFISSGVLAPPEERSMRLYSASRGIRRIFAAENLHKLAPGTGFTAQLLRLRDRLLVRSLTGITSPMTRQRVAALFWGAGSIDPQSRNQFIRSGTIHLFSISGLHVGLLAAVLGLLLRPLPRFWREGTLILLLGGYVFSSGAAPPAMRALLAISIWIILRVFRRRMPPLRVLALIAASFLAFEPPLLFDIGFLYSFLITALLILLGGKVAQWRQETAEISAALQVSPPGKVRQRPLQFFSGWKIGSALAAALIAFFGSTGISLYSRGLLLPGSVAANILVTPLIFPLFVLFGLKLVCGPLPGPGELLELGFQLMDKVTGGTVELFENVPAIRPPIRELVLFYLLLFAALGKCRVRTGLFCGISAVLLLVSWPLRTRQWPAELSVISGDSVTPPMILVSDPAAGRNVVVNVPEPKSTRLAVRELIVRGATRIDQLIFSASKSANAQGVKSFAAAVTIQETTAPSLGSRAFRKRIAEAGLGLRQFRPGEYSRAGEDGRKLYFQAGAVQVEIVGGDLGRQLYCSGGGGRKCRLFLPYRNTPVLYHLPEIRSGKVPGPAAESSLRSE